jgi:hypothetical protein
MRFFYVAAAADHCRRLHCTSGRRAKQLAVNERKEAPQGRKKSQKKWRRSAIENRARRRSQVVFRNGPEDSSQVRMPEKIRTCA